MNGLRLLIATARYWPQVGETELLLSSLASECLRQGAGVSVVTAAWAAHWPRQVVHRGVPVIRLPQAPTGGWNTFRFLRSLTRWLRKNRQRFDVAYVVDPSREAFAATSALEGEPIPVVLGAASADPLSRRPFRLARRIRRLCQKADAIVVTQDEVARQFAALGCDANRLHVIPHGVAPAPPRSSALRIRARESLGAVNHDLATPEYAPVAVCVTRLASEEPLFQLVEAWQPIANRWPSSRLWIVGDGPLRHRLYHHLVDQGLHRNILMPGSFDELEDVFQAADVGISLRPDIAASPAQLQALANGLPLVAVDSTANREVAADSGAALLVPAENVEALTRAVGRIVESAELAEQLGTAGRRLVDDRFTLSRAANDHLRLFTTLVEAKRS